MIIVYDLRRILKFLFNLAILMMIVRMFSAPFDLELQESNSSLLYQMPCLGIIASYLYLAAWMGWKRSFQTMKYVVVVLFIFFYPVAEKLLPTWAVKTINILFLLGLVYLVYRLGKFTIRQFKVLKRRFETYTTRMRNKRNV